MHCGNLECLTFLAPVTLTLDPMTFMYELNPYSLETYRMSESERPVSKLSKVIGVNACVQLTRGHFGHVTKMAVTPFGLQLSKTPCHTRT